VWGITSALGSLFGTPTNAERSAPRPAADEEAPARGSRRERRGAGAGGGREDAEEDEERRLEEELGEEEGGLLEVGGVAVGFTLQERVAQLTGALGAVGTAAARALAASGVPIVDVFIATAHSGTGQLVAAIEGEQGAAGPSGGPVPGPWQLDQDDDDAAAASAGLPGTRRQAHPAPPRMDSGAAVPALVGRPVLANPRGVQAPSAAAGVLPFQRPAEAPRPPGTDRPDDMATAEAGWSLGPRPARGPRRGRPRPRTVSANDGAAGRTDPADVFDDGVSAEDAAAFDATVV